MEGKKLMAIRSKKIKSHKKGMRGLLAEKAAVQARKARKAEREKPHSGAKMRALKVRNKGKRRRVPTERRSMIPTVRA